jgi:hypothetical protein
MATDLGGFGSCTWGEHEPSGAPSTSGADRLPSFRAIRYIGHLHICRPARPPAVHVTMPSHSRPSAN